MNRILVVDDNRDMRESLKELLELSGYQVSLAEDGKKGLRRYQEEKPDLVVLDILMPDMDGLETIGAIQQEQPDAKIIAMSGGMPNGDMLMLEIARRLGAQQIFDKPIQMEPFLAAVAGMLEH